MKELAPVLLAEDEENDCILIREACVKAGITNPLKVVHDGDEAIRYLRAEGPYAARDQHPLPCLLLLDLKLPRVNGYQVLTWLAEQPGLRERLPVVMMSSSDLSDEIERAKRLGVREYLVKPVAFHRLIELMRGVKERWLDRAESSAR